MQITFIGDPRGRNADLKSKGFKPGDPEATTVYGKRFPLNMAVPVDAEWYAKHGAKMRGNGHFLIEESAAPLPAQPAVPVVPLPAAAAAGTVVTVDGPAVAEQPASETIQLGQEAAPGEAKAANAPTDLAEAKGFGEEDFK